MRLPLNVVPVIEDVHQLFAVNLDPFAFDQDQAFTGGKEFLDFLLGHPFAAQGQSDIEVQEGFHSEFRRRLAADLHRNPGPGTFPAAPPVGHAYDQTRLLIQRDLAEKTVGLPGSPGERVVDIARIDQVADEITVFGRP